MYARLLATALGLAVAVTASCTGPEPPPTALTQADSADQVVFGLKHQLTMEGVLRARVEADTAYFYQMSQKVFMRHIRVTFYSAQGVETSTLTANGGIYEWRTQNMEASGNVVAVTPDRRRLTTSALTYERATQQIIGPAAFIFDSPDRHLEGDGFTSDPDFKNVVTQRPRRGTLGKVQIEP